MFLYRLYIYVLVMEYIESHSFIIHKPAYGLLYLLIHNYFIVALLLSNKNLQQI